MGCTEKEGTLDSGQGEKKPTALGMEKGKGRHAGELQDAVPSNSVWRAQRLQQDYSLAGWQQGDARCLGAGSSCQRGIGNTGFVPWKPTFALWML